EEAVEAVAAVNHRGGLGLEVFECFEIARLRCLRRLAVSGIEIDGDVLDRDDVGLRRFLAHRSPRRVDRVVKVGLAVVLLTKASTSAAVRAVMVVIAPSGTIAVNIQGPLGRSFSRNSPATVRPGPVWPVKPFTLMVGPGPVKPTTRVLPILAGPVGP